MKYLISILIIINLLVINAFSQKIDHIFISPGVKIEFGEKTNANLECSVIYINDLSIPMVGIVTGMKLTELNKSNSFYSVYNEFEIGWPFIGVCLGHEYANNSNYIRGFLGLFGYISGAIVLSENYENNIGVSFKYPINYGYYADKYTPKFNFIKNMI